MSFNTKESWKESTACGIEGCRSKRFFEQDGLKYCVKGHQQEGVRTQQDEDDFGASQGRKTRIRKESQEKVSRIYRGHEAIELYLQSYQLILWKQCYAMIHTIGLPAELEGVVKDLWALRLQLLKKKIEATSDEDTVFSSQPQSETEGKALYVEREWKIRGKEMPVLNESLGLCYIGTVLLRLPVSMGDIYRWAYREDIPFIRAVRFVPEIMKRKLPAEYLKALDTDTPLQPDRLRKTIHNLSLFYTHHFKIHFPPLNVHLLLFKYIRDLALPITLYPATLHISTKLSIPFTSPKPGRRQRASSLPEIELISLLVVAVKLHHPFDNLLRHARSLTDLDILAIDWSTWVEALRATRPKLEDSLERGSEINVTEADVMKMTGKQLDQYMDWYERTFIDEAHAQQKEGGQPKQLLDMFPTGRLDGSTPTEYDYAKATAEERENAETRLASVMGSMTLRYIQSRDAASKDSEPVRRVGSLYRRYRKVEDLADHKHARAFYEAASATVGIKLETLVLAVVQVEQKLIAWREARVKEGLEGGDESPDLRGIEADGENLEMLDEGPETEPEFSDG